MMNKHPNNINELTNTIIGCAMKVHNNLGIGFQEIIYQKALAIEMRLHDFLFEQEGQMSIYYNKELIGSRRVDFFVENCVIVELKAIEKIENIHKIKR